jgi:predicted  nucleic acid-binding Zn-ribbon protein
LLTFVLGYDVSEAGGSISNDWLLWYRQLMADTDNIALEHLRHIRGVIDDVRDEIREIKQRVGNLENQYANMSNRLDRMDSRIERIERRLDLTDA